MVSVASYGVRFSTLGISSFSSSFLMYLSKMMLNLPQSVYLLVYVSDWNYFSMSSSIGLWSVYPLISFVVPLVALFFWKLLV